MQSGHRMVFADGRATKDKHDLITQKLLRRVVAKGEERGMKVNNQKTKLLCMSDSNTYKSCVTCTMQTVLSQWSP